MRRSKSLPLGLLTLVLLLSPTVSALGIAQDWHEGRTFNVMQGDTYLHRINIQNERNNFITLQFDIKGEYMSVNGESSIIISIPPRTYNHYEYINITIPKNETPGKTIKGTYSVQQIDDEGGQVGLGIKLSDDFTVVVEKSPTPFDKISGQVSKTIEDITSNKTVLVGVFVLLLVVFLIVVYRQSEILGNILSKKDKKETPPITNIPEPDEPAPTVVEAPISAVPEALTPVTAAVADEPPGEAFVSVRGWATSINELALLISQMDEETYNSHHGKHGNEFANWVYHHTKDYDKYEQVLNSRTKEELVNNLLFSL